MPGGAEEVVHGAGGLGHIGVQCLRALTAASIVVLDANQAALELARGWGADETVLACPFHGIRYDCGSKLGYLKAILAYGRKHPEVGQAFTEFLASLNVGGRP